MTTAVRAGSVAAVTHWGGTGRYVEGERVFAPPSGTVDADWVAAIVRDRLGADAPERLLLVSAAQAAWAHLRSGSDLAGAAAALALDGLSESLADAVVAALADYLAAYEL